MCRMLLFTGNDEELFNSLLRSLEEVCKSDPLHDYQKKPFLDHKDGWGFVDSGKGFLSFTKYTDPIFHSGQKIFHGDIRLIHARNATVGEPLTLTSTHPFHLPLDDYDVYFAHNGWIDKNKLTDMFNQDFKDTRSDSEIFLNLLGQFPGTPLQRLKAALEQVYSTDSLHSGLNIFLLSVNRRTQDREVYVYSDARNFDLYHWFFFIKSGNSSAVVSSSVPEAESFPKACQKVALSPGTIYSIENNSAVPRQRVEGSRNASAEEAILLK